MSLDFSAFHLVINEEYPSVKKLNLMFSETSDRYKDGNTYYLINKEILHDKCFWFDVRYGQSQPRPHHVINTKSQTEESNPRSAYQIEPNKQLFGLYCLNSYTLYLSNQKKQSWVENYFKGKLSANVTIKKFFKSFEEFVQQTSKIKNVKFVAKRDLFIPGEELMSIFPNPQEVFGLNVPESFTLDALFKNAPINNVFIQNMKKIIRWEKKHEVSSLLCVGLDDKNIETIFDINSYVRKIAVDATKNDQGLYDSTAIKNALVEKIREVHEDNS